MVAAVASQIDLFVPEKFRENYDREGKRNCGPNINDA